MRTRRAAQSAAGRSPGAQRRRRWTPGAAAERRGGRTGEGAASAGRRAGMGCAGGSLRGGGGGWRGRGGCWCSLSACPSSFCPLRVLSRTLRGACYKPDNHSVGEPPWGAFFRTCYFAWPPAIFSFSFASCLAGCPKHCCSSARMRQRKDGQISSRPCIRHIQRRAGSEL